MAADFIIYDPKEHIGYITLNRPQSGNRIDSGNDPGTGWEFALISTGTRIFIWLLLPEQVMLFVRVEK